MYSLRDFSSTIQSAGWYLTLIMAKSGKPERGHKQVNSGMSKQTIYGRSGCGLGHFSSVFSRIARVPYSSSSGPISLLSFMAQVYLADIVAMLSATLGRTIR